MGSMPKGRTSAVQLHAPGAPGVIGVLDGAGDDHSREAEDLRVRTTPGS